MRFIDLIEKAKDLSPRSNKETFVSVVKALKTMRANLYRKIGGLSKRLSDLELEVQKSEETHSIVETRDSKKLLDYSVKMYNDLYYYISKLKERKSYISKVIKTIEGVAYNAVEYRIKAPTLAQKIAEDCGNYNQPVMKSVRDLMNET